ncbi:TerB N-terminal domain-containing protein [Shouchella lehensis]|uniref:TerB N-terminal domain-containing protein n=1 Tax=Shouchella lehensis TaxID=300825 RepID=A0A4Y7WKW5_9BACI|nr:TerB N-terminal domain-containing protein [Shouchella lehensis]MBG9783476.1 hypothetical protein [Shouchella lehensis]TES49130.1 hypothetical protein E2L03_06500 [Shouchella lehensis]
MGIFDIFKKKRKYKQKKSDSRNLLSVNDAQAIDPIKNFFVHSDIKGLLWIENGPQKNFISISSAEKIYEIDGVKLFIQVNKEEPSLINMNLDIKESIEKEVPIPGYYPSYRTLSSEQRYKYWQSLSNPYQASIDISYIFILYYGLERHLFLNNNFEMAFKVIIKLREIHQNKSFLTYSGNAIALSCLLHQKADMMNIFIESLNTDYKRNFSEHLYLLALHSFDRPLLSEDIMRLSKVFGFRNDNYIKSYPDIFKRTLEELIVKKHSKNHLILKELVPHIGELDQTDLSLFANISLSEEKLSIANLISSPSLNKEIYNFLSDAHESVKKQLANMRKTNMMPKKHEKKKPIKELKFDFNEEQRLIKELKGNYSDPVSKHFTYIYLQDFYYKYRILDEKYLHECIKYCYEDLEILEDLNTAFVNEEMKRTKHLSSFRTKKDIDNDLERIKAEKFQGRIPAFNRLAIIYEKKKQFPYAIDISKKAINYYKARNIDTSDFEKRIERLNKKLKV